MSFVKTGLVKKISDVKLEDLDENKSKKVADNVVREASEGEPNSHIVSNPE